MHRRLAFTLVELLVVIAIIGILVSLLLPAVQSARGAARRAQCQSNLKQLAIAVLNFESAQGHFPEGAHHTNPVAADPSNHFANWGIHLLPYMEEQPLHDQYHFDLYNSHPDNLPVLRTPLSVYKCPSDTAIPDLLVPTQIRATAPTGIAISSYKGVSGTRWGPTNGFFDYPNFASQFVPQRAFRGPFIIQGVGDLDLVEMRDIVDGTSHSLMIGEYATEESAQVNATGTAFWGSTHSFHNLGAPQREFFTRLPSFDKCMELTGNQHWYCDRAYASLHVGRQINFVMCDGSVRTIRPEIDGNIFTTMATIAGEELVRVPK